MRDEEFRAARQDVEERLRDGEAPETRDVERVEGTGPHRLTRHGCLGGVARVRYMTGGADMLTVLSPGARCSLGNSAEGVLFTVSGVFLDT